MNRLLTVVGLSCCAVVLAGCAGAPPATKDYPAPSTTAAPPPMPATPTTGSAAAAAATVAATGVSATPSAGALAGAAVDPNAAGKALAAAVSAYERGEFSAAIRQLSPLTHDGGLDATQQLRALKVLAFSQCSVNARTQCRQTFERALRADASFDLTPAERGHPLWQPEFDRAKKAVARP